MQLVTMSEIIRDSKEVTDEARGLVTRVESSMHYAQSFTEHFIAALEVHDHTYCALGMHAPPATCPGYGRAPPSMGAASWLAQLPLRPVVKQATIASTGTAERSPRYTS